MKIKTVIIGYGYRGQYLARLMASIDVFALMAICDTKPMCESIGECRFYSDVQQMLDLENPDLVVIASNWNTHHGFAIEALNHGCDIALEVKGELFEGEYDQVMEVAKQNNRKIFPLENTLFKREVMAMVNMCGEGVLGELVWGSGSYRHDLRELLFGGDSEHWRAKYYREQGRGDIYPTHSFAPIALAMGLRDRVQVANVSVFQNTPKGVPNRGVVLGDVVTTIIETTAGKLIELHHDTTLPRPRELGYRLQGTKGVWDYERGEIYIEGVSPYEQWESAEPYIARHEAELWQQYGKQAQEIDAHHQGMDYIMLRAVADDLKGVREYIVTCEDLALWAGVSLQG